MLLLTSNAPELFFCSTALAAIGPAIGAVSPLATSKVGTVPASVSVALPASVTVPSSNVIPAALCALASVTVKVPVASVPAEKTAVLVVPLQAPGATVPAELVLQKLLVPQFPVGVVPAPPVAPLESQ